MANVKISQLPAATTIIPTADVAPIVHSGVTQKATPNLIVQSVLPAPGPIGNVTPSTGVFTQVGIVGASGIQKAISGGLLTNAVVGTDYVAPGGALGTPSSGTLTNCTGLPVSTGISGLGTGVAAFLATPSSANLASAVTDETGTGALVFANTPTLVTPNLGTPASGTLTNCSGLPIVGGTTGTLTVARGGTGATTLTGLVKGNGTSAFTAAVSGTDYAPATTGTSIFYGNGAGGFSNVVIGSNMSFVGGVLATTAGGGSVTSASVVTANGFAGTVATPSSTPAITLSTTVTGLLKGNGTAISAATAGTDYAAAPTGTNAQLLANNGSGGFSNVTVGSGLTYSAGTLSATGGSSGTVTTVSVVSANGLGGTVANATTTPAITLTTSVTGLLKGNGTGVSAAVSGTDYAPATSGSSILYGNGSGGFSNVTVSGNLSFSGGTLTESATPTYTDVKYTPQATAPTVATGTTWYDSNSDSFAYYNSTGYETFIGQQVDQVIYNNTGSTLNVGQAVYINGSSGGYATVALAQATSISNANAIGMVAQSIPNGSTGMIVILGRITSYDTSGIAGSPAAGAAFYLSSSVAGGLTTVQPTSPYYAVRMGFILTTGTSGSIFTSVRNVYSLGSNIVTPVSLTAFSTSSSPLQLYGYSSGQIADLFDVYTYSGGTKCFYIDNAGNPHASGTLTIGALTVTGTTTLATSLTGLLKSTSGVVSTATSGTDYAPATSGNSILYGNGSGGFSNVTVGTGLSFSTGTLSNSSPMTYPSSGIPNSTGSAWGTSYSTTGSGTVIALATSPTLVTPVLGTPTSGTLTNCTGLPIATGVSGLGTGVATALAVNTGSSGAFVVNGGALGTPSSGTLSSCTVDGTNSVGFRNIPQVSESANYTTVLSDSGKHIFHPSTDTNARTFTIDSNANVAYPVGTAITFVNMSSSAVTIAITSDTMYLAGTGTTGSRTLAQYGTATALKIATTTWLINGNGLT